MKSTSLCVCLIASVAQVFAVGKYGGGGKLLSKCIQSTLRSSKR